MMTIKFYKKSIHIRAGINKKNRKAYLRRKAKKKRSLKKWF